MTPERLREHVDAVKAAAVGGRARDRARARRKLDRLEKKIAAGGHDHLEPLRAKLAVAAGDR